MLLFASVVNILTRGIYSSNRPGFLPQLFFAHAQIAPVFFPNFFSLTLKKIEFLAQTPLIITFYCIFKLQFFENCPKKLNFCPKIGKIRYVPVCFPIFVQMYRFLSPPPFSFLEEYIPLPLYKEQKSPTYEGAITPLQCTKVTHI